MSTSTATTHTAGRARTAHPPTPAATGAASGGYLRHIDRARQAQPDQDVRGRRKR